MQSSISKTVSLSSRRWFVTTSFSLAAASLVCCHEILFVVMIHVLCASISMRFVTTSFSLAAASLVCCHEVFVRCNDSCFICVNINAITVFLQTCVECTYPSACTQ